VITLIKLSHNIKRGIKLSHNIKRGIKLSYNIKRGIKLSHNIKRGIKLSYNIKRGIMVTTIYLTISTDHFIDKLQITEIMMISMVIHAQPMWTMHQNVAVLNQ
jgi:hypothetical protein